ncbi:MAG: hypothetical protein L0Y58_22085 [Verrucomicrobia subdivision 3 bacterium]|nr:hypothetical protein [Limisphaerales bacterium]
MKLPYKYTVADEVLGIFSSVSSARRQRLLSIFSQIAADPFLKGDTIQKDATGRECQVKRFGEWIVIYWAEHLADQVHIVSVERLRL